MLWGKTICSWGDVVLPSEPREVSRERKFPESSFGKFRLAKPYHRREESHKKLSRLKRASLTGIPSTREEGKKGGRDKPWGGMIMISQKKSFSSKGGGVRPIRRSHAH